MSRWFAAAAAAVLLLSTTPTALAVDDDTRFLLERLRRTTDHLGQPADRTTAPPGQIFHEGQLFSVGDQPDELEAALYITLNSGQWERLVEFIARYRTLPAHRAGLVAMAEALLERQAGATHDALQRMQLAHLQEPDDLRIALELARLRFEDNQDHDARAGIEQLLSAQLPPHTQGMLQQYINALDQRRAWHGSAALGAGRNDNINQANGDYTCFFQIEGDCLFDRQMPFAASANMLSYDLALQRRVSLQGNHNLQLRALGYGSQFQQGRTVAPGPARNNGSHRATLLAGYQYLDARSSITAGPYLEYQVRAGRGDYLAPGLQLEWRRALGARWQIGSVADARRHHSTRWGQRLSGDYSQYQWGISANYAPQPNTSLFGGLDLTRSKHAIAQSSTGEAALRAGVFHAFTGGAGLYVNAQSIFRLARADAHDGFLGARRCDRQQVYMATVGAEA